MQNELTQRWVEELRSGRWNQGRGQLKDNNHYCCLGVLCDISEVDTWRRDLRSGDPEKYIDEYQALPSEVRERANIRDESGQFQVTDEWWDGLPEGLKYQLGKYLKRGLPGLAAHGFRVGCSLATLNDSGAPFSIIAEVIMNEPPGLFYDDDDEEEEAA